uniref:Large ribosomal subunit protein uL10m n=1 Tax=Oncorhynchus mykiss TaxID=8022 RepID=A0A8C7SAZ2_ONCMY
MFLVYSQESGLVLLLKDLQTVFQDCKMIAVIQNNPTNSEDILLLKNRSYLPDSPYINMGPLLIGQTVIFVIKEPKVKQMFLSLRTSPQVVLLGNRGCGTIAKLSSVTLVQGKLVSGLTMMTPQTASMLQRHPVHHSLLLHQNKHKWSRGDPDKC